MMASCLEEARPPDGPEAPAIAEAPTKTTSVKVLLPAKSWKIESISPESITEGSCLQAASSELQSTEESFCQVSRLFYRRDGGRHGQHAELWRYAAF